MAEDPGKAEVGDLVSAIHNGEYVIPHFQRGYEWQPSMVSDLFESIIQDYFAGLLLFWELSADRVDTEVWDPVWGAPPAGSSSRAILDGQQRLASLYYAIRNPHKRFPNRKTYYTWYLDLEKCLDEEYEQAVDYRYSFNYHPTSEFKDDIEEWLKKGVLPLTLLSDSDFLNSDLVDFISEFVKMRQTQGMVQGSWAETFGELFKLVQGILNYEFITTTLRKDRDIHDICNIFARINQKGMRLSTFDLMNAFLFPHGIKLRKRWEALDNRQLKAVDRSMNEYLLKLISLHKQRYCSSKYIYNLIPEERTKKKTDSGQMEEVVLVDDRDEFLALWDKACRYAEKARERMMNVGNHEFGAIKSKFIPNTTIVPVLGALLWVRSKREYGGAFEETLDRWYWSAVLSGDYSGSSDTVMAEDFRDWLGWFDEGTDIRRMSRVVPDFIKNELHLRETTRGAQYNAILCMLALNGARDFFTGRPLATGDYAGERINDHHIFPSKVEGLSPSTSTAFEEHRDSILNRTLLLDETNKNEIGSKRPSVYLNEMLDSDIVDGREELEELMEGHFISSAALDCLFNDDFDGFIAEREKTLKEHMLALI